MYTDTVDYYYNIERCDKKFLSLAHQNSIV